MTKERDNAPLCLGVIPTAWLERAMFLPLPLLAFRAQLHWEVWGGSLRAVEEARKDGNGWKPKWKCVDGSELFGKKGMFF